MSESPQAGFWKCYYRLGLNLKRRIKKTPPRREKKPLSVVNKPDIQWVLDFMHDALYCGKRFRMLNIIDEGIRGSLAIEVDTSLPAYKVIRVLERFNGPFRREFLNV